MPLSRRISRFLFSLVTLFAYVPVIAGEVHPTSVAAPSPSPQVIPPEAAPWLRALRERRVVTFRYHGHDRVVEPHACGIASNGERVVHGYQTAGGSVTGDLPGWRTFTLAEIGALVVTEKTFAGPRPDYAAAHLRLDPLWGELAPRE